MTNVDKKGTTKTTESSFKDDLSDEISDTDRKKLKN